MGGIGTYLLPRSAGGTFLATLVFWNPLLAGAITFILGGRRGFFEDWLVALMISDVVASQCFAGAHVARAAEVFAYRMRGGTAPVHGAGFYLVFMAFLMPLGLPLGFWAGGAAARWLGFAWSAPGIRSYRIGIGFGLIMTALFFFLRARSDAKEAARTAEAKIRDLETAHLRAQLAALTAEMNPHLLFNALNTVASLIHRDPDRAEDVVLELSDLYRGVLKASGASTHTLREELDLCEAYLKIEHARFGDRLGMHVDVDASADPRWIRVPVLVLQPFVENAVKHGIAPRARGGRVSLRVRRVEAHVELRVEDDGVGLGGSAHRGAGRAVVNCKERLGLAYGSAAALTVADAPGGGTRVVVRIPLAPSDAGGAA